MSERVRKTIGITALLLSVVLCLIPSLSGSKVTRTDYQSGDNTRWRIKSLQPGNYGTIRINEADAEELTCIPGIGEKISSLIVAERETNGPFYYPEDLLAVHGIGPVLLRIIKNLIDLE